MTLKSKYPRTYHFEFSDSLQNDDRRLESLEKFVNQEVIVSEKLDGENTSLSNTFIHARSLDSVDHPSRHWIKGLWGMIKHDIPDGMIICMENCYAKHSIGYDDLETYGYVLNIWQDDQCLSYDETLQWCELLGLIHVPVLYRGIFDYELIKSIYKNLDFEKQEGIVCRISGSFERENFSKYVAKAVRPKHVTTDEHWMSKPIEPNKLK